MIKKIDLDLPNTIAFRVSGKIDDVSFKRSTMEMMRVLDQGKCNLYLEIQSIKGITFLAIWDSIKLVLRHLGEYLKKVDKIAVLTDVKWVEQATKLENTLIPAIEEKVFSLDERERAIGWLSK